MTAWAWVFVALIVALVGTLIAVIVGMFRAESRRLDEYLAQMNADYAAIRANRERAAGHIRRGGKGPCVICGDPSDGAR